MFARLGCCDDMAGDAVAERSSSSPQPSNEAEADGTGEGFARVAVIDGAGEAMDLGGIWAVEIRTGDLIVFALGGEVTAAEGPLLDAVWAGLT